MSSHENAPIEPTDVAIVGMAGRFPGARDLDTFWELIASGRNAFTRLTDEQLKAAGVPAELRSDPAYVPVAGMLEDVESFDAEFFDIGPRDAALMDPQHRHFLEICWEALEDAGHVPSRFGGSIGVYAGSGMNGYLVNNLLPNRDLVDPLGLFAVRHTSNDKDFLSTGVSYRLNLKGPSVNVQTACSTSLVSLHLAAQALISGECDMALAGGVTIEVPHGQGYLYREGEILARDGVCRAFDAASSGTVLTSGAGVVVLRRLSDAIADRDHIYSVVKATAINNDGAGKVGYLAPSVDGHAAVVAEAQELAGVPAGTIQYVEAHGTGTPVGDPIEVVALTQAFRRSTDKTGFARIGSTKPTIGHLDTAAGVASVIKTSLALSNQTLPPMANFTAENPLLDVESTPFVLSSEAAEWPRLATPRRAGVSSLGVGGTNAHAILEEAPEHEGHGQNTPARECYHILPLSAKTPLGLDRARARLADHLERHTELRLADVAFTLQEGREEFAYRDAIAAKTLPEAISKLRTSGHQVKSGDSPSIVFMFPGGGAQYPGMGRELYDTEVVYRAAADRCFEALEPELRSAVRELLYPPPEHEEAAAEQLALPSVQLPAIFLTEYALAQLWLSWGIRPSAMTGHSLGEYVAACIAGVFALEDAMKLVALRGRIMERFTDAAMLSVALPEPALAPLLRPGVSLAAVNAPDLCLVSGSSGPMNALETELAARDVISRRLRFRGAVHCSLLDPYLDEFANCLREIKFSEPQMPYISNVTGAWVRPEQAQSVDYWVNHLRYTVRFADGLATLLQNSNRVLIEVGPGNTLATLARQQPMKPIAALSALAHPAEWAAADSTAYSALGRLWAAGVNLEWVRCRTTGGRRVSLPPYQFERTRHWFDAPLQTRAAGLTRLEPDQWTFRPAWRRSDLIGSPPNIEDTDTWLVVGNNSLAKQTVTQLRLLGADVVKVRAGKYTRHSAWDYSARMGEGDDWTEVASQLANFRQMVAGVIWAAPLDAPPSPETAFYGPVAMLQSLQAAGHRPASLTIVTRGAFSVDGEAAPGTLSALAEGVARVAPAEFESLKARVIDLESGGRASAAEAVVAEATLGNETVVALRNGRRWVRAVEQLPSNGSAPAWDCGRSVLITGGLKGIGLSLAKYLAENRPGIKLTLVARSEVPPREKWAELIQGRSARSELVRALSELEHLGAELLTCAADVADATAMTDAFNQAAAKFGGVDTVFHAAGVVDDAPILTKGADEMGAVLRPKVNGTNTVISAAQAARTATVVLFSSVSAEVGLAGQVDYSAANAYLNALAAAPNTRGPRVVTVEFGRWDEVGMAAARREIADGLPFLGKQVQSGKSTRFVSTKMPEDLWVLDGHRLQSGTSIMPGTGYLQAFVAAVRCLGASTVGLSEIQFSEALPARNGEAITFTTKVSRDVVSVSSRQAEHASARLCPAVAATERTAPFTWASQSFEATGRPSFQDGRLVFGPRWGVLRGIERDGDTTYATLAVADEYADDFAEYDLHPALLDIALSCGVRDEFLASDSVVAPVRCDRFEAFAPLPPKIRVVSTRVQSPDTAEVRFDVTILDETGTTVVVRAQGMTYRRLPADSVSRISASTNRAPKPLVPYGSGLTPQEAWPVFERALGMGLNVVGLSSVAVAALTSAAVGAQSAEGTGALLKRPDLGTEMEEPRDDIEVSLARIWRDCLGVDGLGVNDDFFELGGHSLIALRLISRIQSDFGTKLLLANIQERPTIALQAELLRGAGHTAHEAPAADGVASRESNLVILREGDKQPFFCVHGMFGNVMNFTDLAAAGPEGRPFIAIQQHGLDGTPSPYRTIESMAAAYLDDLRRYQPEGPYALGGYSAGGCIALEMARQLVAQGETVTRVVMLDSWGPAMVGRTVGLRFSRMIRRLRFEGPKMVSRKIRFTIQSLRPRPGSPGQVELKNVLSEKRVFASVELGNIVVEALHNYDFASVDVPVTLITAVMRDPETKFLPGDLGWRRILPHIEVRPTQVPHITMCTGTNARIVAEAIADALDG